jgi:cold-inducible RNA-binding protein
MAKKLFVGGLSWNTTQDELREAFAKFGDLEDVHLATDRDSGRSRGFGFVTYADPVSADKAISEMNGTELDGRSLKVDQAHDKPRGGGGGGGGRW